MPCQFDFSWCTILSSTTFDQENMMQKRDAFLAQPCCMSCLMLKSESTRCYLCQRKQSDPSSKVGSKRKRKNPIGLRFSKLRQAAWGTTSSELLQHLKEDFDIPLHPHFVQRILEMGIKMYRKWNDVHGAVFQLSVPGFDDKTSKEVNISEAATDTFTEPRSE